MAAILADNNFKCIFLNENDRIPIQNIDICSHDSNWQYISIVSDDGLATSHCLNQCWATYTSLGGDELIH